MPKFVCQCGGVIQSDRPPSHCPHCGAKIGRVRHRGRWLPLIVVAALFLALLAFAAWLAGQV